MLTGTLTPVPDGDGASGSRPMLALDDITVRFGGIPALTGVSLSVGRGEVCGLIGPNGAGKTTLFDVVSGVAADEVIEAILEQRGQAS